MKRKPILFAFALVLVVGVALGGVNYRLNHPPLSRADKQFRASVAGAYKTKVWQWNCQPVASCGAAKAAQYPDLDAAQTRKLIEHLRLVDARVTPFAPDQTHCLNLTFLRKEGPPVWLSIYQKPRATQLGDTNARPAPTRVYQVNPRFDKPLNDYLDEVWPNRK